MRKHPVLTTAFVTAALVGVGHAWSISGGLFLDDHAHYKQLRAGDWSYRSAVAASRLGIVGDVMDLWSRHEAGLRFYRPVAFWIMRLEYTLVGWRPAGMHVFSLLWHWLCAMLVGAIAWRLIGRRAWAAVAAGLMAVHPGHVVTVYWIACQTELMATAFLLAATLCYARYARWWPREAAPDRSRNAPSASWPALAGALLLFAMALGCREHVILWPAVILVGDFALRACRRRRIPAYVAMAVVVVAYLAARHEALGGFPLPGRPYLVRPGDPGFVRYILDKFIYYMIGLFAYVPVLPIGGTDYFSRHPGTFYGTFAGAVAGVGVILAASPRRRWLLLPLAWATMFFVPLLPVFASTHHLYLPGAGMAWLLAAGLATLAGTVRAPCTAAACAAEPRVGGEEPSRLRVGLDADDRPGPAGRRVVAATLAGLHLIGFAFLCWAFGWAYRASTRVEDIVVRDVLQSQQGPRPIRDGDHLFFVNVSMLAYYAVPAIENQTGLRGLRGHILTFSPWLLRMEKAGTLERVDDRTIVVTAPPGEPYFAGVAGRAVRTIMGFERPFQTDDRLAGPLFNVEVLDADAAGVRRLRFRFHKSLASPDCHLFFGSPTRWAYPLD